MSAPGSGLVYREFGSPLPYGDLRVYAVVNRSPDDKWEIQLKRSQTAVSLNNRNTERQDMETVHSYNNPNSTIRLEWIGADAREVREAYLENIIKLTAKDNTPLTRLLQTSPNVSGYIVAKQPISSLTAAAAAPMGFAVLSQVRWLGDKDIVTRMVMIASAAFVLVVLLDGGARQSRTGGSFGNVEFIRSFYWAWAVGGLVVTGTAMHMAFAEAKYPDDRTAFRIVDVLSI